MWHSGYVLTYAVCPMLLCIKLQTEIDFNTTRKKYIAFIQVIGNTLYVNEGINKVYLRHSSFRDRNVLQSFQRKSKLHCSCAIKKNSTRKKLINIKHHDYWSFIKNKIIQLWYIDTREKKHSCVCSGWGYHELFSTHA